jgi:hypothetical protein
LRQTHAEAVGLAASPADYADRLAKSTCAWPGGYDSGTNVSRPRGPRDPDIVLHNGVAAAEPLLVAQPFETRFAVCRCFTGPVRSASRIASITGSSAPSFGFVTGFVRV